MGGGGFVGRHAAAALRTAGHDVHGLARRPPIDNNTCVWHAVDLLDNEAVTRLIDHLRRTCRLHLAWEIAVHHYWAAPENLQRVEAMLHLVRRMLTEHGMTGRKNFQLGVTSAADVDRTGRG